MHPKTLTEPEFRKALADYPGGLAWPGLYPVYFLMADGGALSFESAKAEAVTICRAIADQDSPEWLPVAVQANYEDNTLFCSHSNRLIPSAYGLDTPDTPNA